MEIAKKNHFSTSKYFGQTNVLCLIIQANINSTTTIHNSYA